MSSRSLSLLLTLLVLCFWNTSSAQIVASQDTSIYCTDTVTLNASVVSATGTTVTLSDDQYSGIINIGFPFIWYGNIYTQCLISSNNYLTFDLTGAGGYSPWPITTNIPSTTNPLNSTMGPWQDILPPNGGTIRYATVGTAPNRIFVVEYCNIPMFSCTSLQFSSQIQLHENGNAMETHIISKPICSTWNSGQAIHGTHDATGTLATAVPGRNAGTQWSATNEGYRFNPNFNFTAYTIQSVPFAPIIVGAAPSAITWTANGASVGTGNSITVSPTTSTAYVASVSGGCSGINFTDTVIVSVPSAPNILISATMPDSSIIHEGCGNSVVTFYRNTNINTHDTLVIDITGTASNGVDYPVIADSVFFTPGMSSYQVNLFGIMDNFTEVAETLHVEARLLDPCIFTKEAYTLIIRDLPAVQVTLNPDTTICPGGTAVLLASGSGGVFNNPLTYTWSPNGSGPFQQVQPPLTQTYIVTVTDSCAINYHSDTMTVHVMPPIYASAGQDMDICAGDSITLFGSGAQYYQWYPALNLSNPYAADPLAQPTVTTTYQLTISDGLCIAQDSVTITVNPLPVVSVTPDDTLICLASSALLSASGASVYTWAPTNALSSATGSQVIATPSVSTLYTVTGTDVNGCKSATTTNVYVNPPLFVEAYGDTTLCASRVQAPLSAFAAGGNGGPYTYTWSPNVYLSSPTGQQVLAEPDQPQWYVVTLTDHCGTPAATDTVLVNVLPIPEIVAFASDSTGCEPMNIRFTNLTNDAASSYWNFGDKSGSSVTDPEHEYDAGTFQATLEVTNSHGCKDTADIANIHILPQPVADFVYAPSVTNMVNPRVYFEDRSTGDIVRWLYRINEGIFYDTIPTFYYTFAGPGLYEVTQEVENIYGCRDEITYTILVQGAFTIYVPNAFSPNGDAINDVFHVVGDDITYFELQVFDRWGHKVFESNRPELGWDGTYHGEKAPQDTYVYRLVAESSFEESRIEREGMITLVR